MTIGDSILSGVRRYIGSDLFATFTRIAIRQLCRIEDGSFNPIFQGMRIDPGAAPRQPDRLRGIFVRLQRGVYQLSEKGRGVVSSISQDIPAFEKIPAIEALLAGEGYWSVDEAADARDRVLREVVQRQGQPAFRTRLLEAYRGRCAVTGCDADVALEAAHIVRYLGQISNQVSNGILLRADIHTLFDLDFLAIHPEQMSVVVADTLKMTVYGQLNGEKCFLPDKEENRPNREALWGRWSRFIAAQ